MEEQTSIFSEGTNTLDITDFYKVARWSNFIGIVLLFVAGAFLLFGMSLRTMIENIFSLSQSTILFPLFNSMETMSKGIWLILIFLISLIIGLLGFLFIQIAKSGRDYYYTQSDIAYVKMMRFIRLLFLVGIISTLLTLIPTLLNIFNYF